jgi:hypothetical protein
LLVSLSEAQSLGAPAQFWFWVLNFIEGNLPTRDRRAPAAAFRGAFLRPRPPRQLSTVLISCPTTSVVSSRTHRRRPAEKKKLLEEVLLCAFDALIARFDCTL